VAFSIERMQLKYFLPCFVWEAVTIQPATTTAIWLQQVGKIGFAIK